MKKNLYIIIDKLYGKNSGGLVASYINLSELLKETYNIKIVSVFKHNCNDCFENFEKISVIEDDFDINFPKLFKSKKILAAIKNSFLYFTSIKKARKKIKNIINNNDIVIVSSPSAAIFMPKIKFILEIHTSYKYFFKGFGVGRLQTLLMRKPSLTIFRTKFDSDHAPKYLNPIYIYNFFDNSNIKVNTKLIKNKIIFMGRLEKEKNPLRLIEIANILKTKNNNFILDIYGTGSLEKKIKNKIKEYHLEKNVFLKGFTNNKNIYKNYSLLWLTSIYEGFGLVIIEAKANKIPCISTNFNNGVYEIITNDGFIIDDNEKFAETTNQILNNSKLQKDLSIIIFNLFQKKKH